MPILKKIKLPEEKGKEFSNLVDQLEQTIQNMGTEKKPESGGSWGVIQNAFGTVFGR